MPHEKPKPEAAATSGPALDRSEATPDRGVEAADRLLDRDEVPAPAGGAAKPDYAERAEDAGREGGSR